MSKKTYKITLIDMSSPAEVSIEEVLSLPSGNKGVLNAACNPNCGGKCGGSCCPCKSCSPALLKVRKAGR